MANEQYNFRLLNSKLKEDSKLIDYLTNQRSLTMESIDKFWLGKLNLYKKTWITIPLFNKEGEFIEGYKLRLIPEYENNGSRYMHYPKGLVIDTPYNSYNLNSEQLQIVICEGEFDCILLDQLGFSAVSSNTGVANFKDTYLDILADYAEIVILFDNDKAGVENSKKLAEKVSLKYPTKLVSIATIPNEEGVKDVTDYIGKYNEIETVMEKREKFNGIDVSALEEMTLVDIKQVLDPVIKRDETQKVISFLAAASTYTPESQLNVAMIAPSSTGKTYITNIITSLLPEEDVISLQYASPKAFYHEYGEFRKKTNSTLVDLEKKCVFFADQPSTHILETLRPILSHDKKEISSKITDKNRAGGNATKTVTIRGYPSLFFCTVSLNIDEQESTRFIMLSPEVSYEKIVAGVQKVIDPKESKGSSEALEELRKRFLALKYLNIKKIEIKEKHGEQINKFLEQNKPKLAPRDMRDTEKIIFLIHSLALLNFSKRKIKDNVLYVSDDDVSQVLDLWSRVVSPQSYGLPMYLMDVWLRVFLPLFQSGCQEPLDIEDVYLTKDQILKKYFETYSRILRAEELQDIIRIFSSITFLEVGNDATDGRKQTYKLSEEGKNIYNKQRGGYLIQ